MIKKISYEKIRLFFDLKKKVHVSCDGRFYNGTILEVNKEKGFMILVDIKLGEIPILFEEILSLEVYYERGF